VARYTWQVVEVARRISQNLGFNGKRPAAFPAPQLTL
jgi:hypothetical protein